jgi:3-hydroxyacyl-[acyl-carrier-protein] dehydratase
MKKKISFNIKEIQQSQQNKYPLLFIDKIIKCEPGKKVISIKNFTYNEWFFPAHFEDEPNVPGFIQIESMAQSFIMTFLSLKKYKNLKTNFLDLESAKFRKKIVPGDTLKIISKLDSLEKGLATGTSEGYVEKELACSASFIVTIPEIFNKYLPKNK